MPRHTAWPNASTRCVGFLALAVSIGLLGTTRLDAACGLHCTALSCWWEQSSGKWFRSSSPCNDWWISTDGCSYPYCDCTGMSGLITLTEQNLTKISCPRADPNNVQATGCPADKDGGLIKQVRCCVRCVPK
jgi:hypothetical protein